MGRYIALGSPLALTQKFMSNIVIKSLQWPSKRVEALGERKIRDIVGILPQLGHLQDKAQNSGTAVLAILGWLATMI